MSDESSRQQHPEANLLAGFAESSLTQQEHESVLSHLAACARCRQVVFLAHQVEPTPDTQTSSLTPPLWRRHWFPLLASASAVVALATLTFSWYGQSHKQTAPPGQIAQQRIAATTSGNAKSAEVAPPPRSAAPMEDGKPAAKRVPVESKAKQTVASATPLQALNSSRASGGETRRLTKEVQQTAGRDGMESGSNSGTQKVQSTAEVHSAAGLNTGAGDMSGYSARAIQPGKVSSGAKGAWDASASSGAVGAAPQAYRQQSPAPPAKSNRAPEAKQVHAAGCVEQGVEAGCLMVKDRQSGQLYQILIKGPRPQPGAGIEFTGVPHEGPTSCMQGIPLDVITWVHKSSPECANAETPKE